MRPTACEPSSVRSGTTSSLIHAIIRVAFQGYALALGIATTDNGAAAYVSGSYVTSTASDIRRSGVSIEFNAHISLSSGVVVTTDSINAAVTPEMLASSISAVVASDRTTYASVAV